MKTSMSTPELMAILTTASTFKKASRKRNLMSGSYSIENMDVAADFVSQKCQLCNTCTLLQSNTSMAGNRLFATADQNKKCEITWFIAQKCLWHIDELESRDRRRIIFGVSIVSTALIVDKAVRTIKMAMLFVPRVKMKTILLECHLSLEFLDPKSYDQLPDRVHWKAT
jgi:hypothetical protein